MLFWVEQAFVGREEIRAPLKTPAWEANLSITIKSLTRCKQKVVLAAMLEGKSMPSNHFVEKSKCHKISPLNAFPLKFRV